MLFYMMIVIPVFTLIVLLLFTHHFRGPMLNTTCETTVSIPEDSDEQQEVIEVQILPQVLNSLIFCLGLPLIADPVLSCPILSCPHLLRPVLPCPGRHVYHVFSRFLYMFCPIMSRSPCMSRLTCPVLSGPCPPVLSCPGPPVFPFQVPLSVPS